MCIRQKCLPLLPLLFCIAAALLFSGCASRSWHKGGVPGSRPYTVNGKRYVPLLSAKGFVEEGTASWYGPGFHGRFTASGEKYNQFAMTAAHTILPLQTEVRVKNLENGRTAVLRINDRGPFVNGRVIDLSRAAAQKLGVLGPGSSARGRRERNVFHPGWGVRREGERRQGGGHSGRAGISCRPENNVQGKSACARGPVA